MAFVSTSFVPNISIHSQTTPSRGSSSPLAGRTIPRHASSVRANALRCALATAAPAAPSKQRLVVSIPGGGVFFFWQAGAVKALRQWILGPSDGDLASDTDVVFAGASAGSLTSVLALCDVDFDWAMEVAAELCDEAGVWDRRFGLFGIWGDLIRTWLDRILPADCADRCRGRVTVHVTELSLLRMPTTAGISDFDDKQAVINACMASVHIPFFLDGRPFVRRGRKVLVDGSFYTAFRLKKPESITVGEESPDYVINYALDSEWLAKVHFLENIGPDMAEKMMERGYTFTTQALKAHPQNLLQ